MNKDLYVQSLKGICIIMVVLIHLPWGQAGEWTAYLWIAERKIINFAVAVFFFLSAYYTKSYAEIKKSGIIIFYKKRLSRLLIPYIVWTIFYVFILDAVKLGHIPDNWLFLLMTGYGPTYFLLALAQLTLLCPIIQKYDNMILFKFLFYSITPVYTFLYYYWNITNSAELPASQTPCFPWFIFYYLGLKFKGIEIIDTIKLPPPIILYSLLIFSLLFAIAEGNFLYTIIGSLPFAVSQISVGSLFVSGIVILVFWSAKSNIKDNVLSKIGDYSMGVFLSHTLFNYFFVYIVFHIEPLKKFYFLEYGYLLLNFSIMLVSLISSFIFSKLLSIYFPKSTKILGLK